MSAVRQSLDGVRDCLDGHRRRLGDAGEVGEALIEIPLDGGITDRLEQLVGTGKEAIDRLTGDPDFRGTSD